MVTDRVEVSEAARLAALRRYDVVGHPPEAVFDDLVRAAARLSGAPIAMLNFVDRTSLWTSSSMGLPVGETPFDLSVCRKLVQSGDDVIVIPDLTRDPRTENNPLVVGAPGLLSYAGAVLRSSEGLPLGALCVLDITPGEPDAETLAGLRTLARATMDRLELRLAQRRLVSLAATPTDAFCLLDDALRLTFLNPAAAMLLGSDEGALLGRSLWREAQPEYEERHSLAFRFAAEAGAPFEFRLAESDRWLLASTERRDDGWNVRLDDVTAVRSQRERVALLENALARIDDIVMITEAEPIGEQGQRIIYANAAYERRSGYAPEEYLGRSPRILQGPRTQRSELDRVRAALTESRPIRVELINYTKSREEFWLELDIAPIASPTGWRTQWVAVQRDVTARKREEIARRAEAQALDMISAGARLCAVLDVIARAVEDATPGARCAIHRVDREGRLLSGAAPSLPSVFLDAVEGTPIGPQTGSCGTAAWRREMVIVEDIATDPLWAAFRHLALPHGLRACWSAPAFDAAGAVVATFALYRDAPGGPSAEETALIARFVRLVSVAHERVSALEALRISEARLAAVVSSTAKAVWEADSSGAIIYVSEGWTAFTGQSREDALGHGWMDAVHPDDRAGVGAQWREVVTQVIPVVAEFRVRNPSGGWRWNEARAAPLRDGEGRLRGWYGLSFDVSDRMEVENRLKATAAVAADAIWDMDLLKRRTVWSDGLAQVFGHDFGADAETIGAWRRHINPLDHRRVHDTFNAALDDGSTRWQAEYRVARGRGGGEAVVIDRAVIIRDGDGAVVRAVGSVSDVTAQRETEDRLRQSQRLEAVGQLTGGVAHDFNNLLTVIMGNAELLEETLPESDGHRALAEMIRVAAERGAELTRRLLAFARRQPLDPKPTDVTRRLVEMDGLLRRTLGAHVEIELVHGGGLWRALIDPVQLESAVLNLCLNARDAMPSGGRLTIETANTHLDAAYARDHPDVKPGQYVMLAVSDAGVGMDAATQARAFEPFFTTKGNGLGSGLGLSMVYGFIKQSSGHVKIYSEPGHGTTVRLYLPRALGPEVAQLNDDCAVEGGMETILVVEDDEAVRGHAVRLLRGLGYRVIDARDGREALEALKRNPDVALLFSDVVMPGGMDGRQLAEAARALRPGLPVLFTSGYTENAIVHHGRLDPGVQLLNKPYRRQQLAAKLRSVLDER